MASNNETVAGIIAEVRTINPFNEYADRIEAAHRREVAELKHWIKSAARWIKCHDIYHTSGDDLIKQAKEILNDDDDFLFKEGEQ